MVWKPHEFLKGNIDSFPYQHDYAILYTAVSVHEFFRDGGDTPHERSAFEVGIRPENERSTGEASDAFDWNAEAIFMGFENVAEMFAEYVIEGEYGQGAAILEVKVPTKSLHTIVVDKDYRNKEKVAPARENRLAYPSNLEELRSNFNEPSFGSPIEAFRHYCQYAASADEELWNAEAVHFAIEQHIPPENILRVWDHEFTKNRNFESKKSYKKHLKGRYGDKIPVDINSEKVRERINKELAFFEELENNLLVLESESSEISQIVRELYSGYKGWENLNKEQVVQLLENLVSKCGSKNGETYRHGLENILSLCQEKDLDISGWASIENLNELIQNELEGDIPELIESRVKEAVENVDLDIDREKEIALENDWDAQKLKKERNYENKMENQILKKLQKIPDLSEVAEDIERNKTEYINKFSQ